MHLFEAETQSENALDRIGRQILQQLRAAQGGERFAKIRKGRIDLRHWRRLGTRVQSGGGGDQEFPRRDGELFYRLDETLEDKGRQRLGRGTSQ